MSIFYFAWVDGTETSFNTSHIVQEEDVFSFTVSQTEGDFASLDITIRNPKVGLLCATRKQWAWLSWDNGSEIEPLFFGRLNAVPDTINKEIISLVFSARPADFKAQKIALANTLKVAPYWDDVWVDDAHIDDPDTVLEARSQLWHIDRVTGDVTVSDLIVGEDGTKQFTTSDVIYQSTQISLKGAPLRTVSVDANVAWDQPADGVATILFGRVIDSFAGDGLIDDWPKPGASLNGGWSVLDSSAVSVPDITMIPDDLFIIEGNGTKIINGVTCYADGTPILNGFGEIPTPEHPVDAGGNGGVFSMLNILMHLPKIPHDWIKIFLTHFVMGFNNIFLDQDLLVPRWHVKTYLNLAYSAKRKRQEHVTFTMHSDVQDIITMADADDPPVISISGRDVGEPLPTLDSNTFPIVDPRRRSYFPTDRGLQSLEYLVSLARSRLLVGARVVEVSCQVPFEMVTGLTLRMNATIHDPRLPGGLATGKVSTYSFGLDGSKGEAVGNVTISCSIGRGGSVAANGGDPLYVDDDYVEDDYEFREGLVELIAGDNVGYSVPIDEPNDDGLNLLQPLRFADVVSNYTVTNDADAQAYAIIHTPIARSPFNPSNNAVEDIKTIQDQFAQVIKQKPTTVSFNLKPVDAGPFTNVYEIQVTNLVIPKMIDLEICS